MIIQTQLIVWISANICTVCDNVCYIFSFIPGFCAAWRVQKFLYYIWILIFWHEACDIYIYIYIGTVICAKLMIQIITELRINYRILIINFIRYSRNSTNALEFRIQNCLSYCFTKVTVKRMYIFLTNSVQ